MASIEPEGGINWQMRYSDPGNLHIYDVRTTPDGRLIASGYASFQSPREGSGMWLLSVDPSDGTMGCSCDMAQEVEILSGAPAEASAQSIDLTVRDLPVTPIATPRSTLDLTVAMTEQCLDEGWREAPGEVSDTSMGEAPLRITKAGTRLVVEHELAAAAYNLYTGHFYGGMFTPAHLEARTCAVTDWTDNGDGTVTIDHEMPGHAWVLVSASNPCGEGTAGAGSAGLARTGQDGWETCGASD